MTLNEVRKKYLEFYKAREHAVIPSASLVPENDPTTLFTSSGMQPLVPYLLGAEHPKGKKLANSQKSLRADDIEEVGDNRHLTFFEMLGNWSLGSYWKDEQLPWFFSFLTGEIGLDPRRLYVSVFSGDEANGVPRDTESVAIWQKIFGDHAIEAKAVELLTEEQGGQLGMQGGRIFYYNAKKNWWSRAGVPANMPAGEPGGPDSEVFFDFAPELGDQCAAPGFGAYCHPNCDCGRFMEIGNSVFMEYRKKEDGSFERLAQRNVDFGGGLERIAAASVNSPDVFKVDELKGTITALEQLFAGTGYENDPKARKSFRIITDHVRAAVFLIADGVIPANKERGYILRRLIRRAAFEAYKLSGNRADTVWATGIPAATLSQYAGHYDYLKEKERAVCEIFAQEVAKFYVTLEEGIRQFDRLVKEKGGGSGITGEEAFIMFSTYGFPLELTVERASEMDMKVDIEGFRREYLKHQDLSRTTSAGTFKGGLADHSEKVIRYHTATHLLHAALRRVLGNHVIQKGSNITNERTRFDFIHSEKMTDEQKKQVEDLVNGWIKADYQVKREVMPLAKARELGAIGAFGEKYDDTVSVYTVYNPADESVFSREFCGGPHVEHTGQIGEFTIAKEEAVAAGIRRIRGVIKP